MAFQAEREAMLNRAREAMQRGDHRAARSLSRYLLRQDPQDAEARAMVARLQRGSSRAPSSGRAASVQSQEWLPRLGLRYMSAIGATALLVLLISALIVAAPAANSVAAEIAPGAAKVAGVRSALFVQGDTIVTATGGITPTEGVTATMGITPTEGVTTTMGMTTTEGTTVTIAARPLHEPPVPSQGGTCISGFIIDRYHQTTGAGLTVTLTSEGGTPVTISADANGEFKFEGLAAGKYSVELDVPEGWTKFTPASFSVTLNGQSSNCAPVRFKLQALPCLEVIKLDAGGKAGFKNQVGIPGWTLTATLGVTVETQVTDGTGRAKFENLWPGTWTVAEEAKVGWEPAKGYGLQETITLNSPKKPGVCEKLTFVNKQVHDGCIKVQKLDQDGKPLKGWEFTLTRDDGTQPSISLKTDANGFATFLNLSLGKWTVTEHMKDWWRPLAGEDSVRKVTLEQPGGVCKDVVFMNEALGCVDGYKINHLGQGLSGWEVKASNGTEEFTATTDSNGYFKFKGLALGTWTISEVLQTGWEPVTPEEFLVEVKEPFACEHVRFKNKTDYACVDVFKVDATDGSGLPGWEITIQPAYGGASLTSQTDGTGWVRFNGLVPGAYIISETMQDGWKAETPTSRQVDLKASGWCSVVTFENRQKTAPAPKPTPTPKPDPPPKPACRYYHKVQPGETLSSIAWRYRTSVSALVAANGIKNPNLIFACQVLCIP